MKIKTIFAIMAVILAVIMVSGCIDNEGSGIGDIFGGSANDNNENTKTWRKIDSFKGVGSYEITFNNTGNNRIKVVSSAMPLRNYADNYMFTTLSRNGYTIASSDLSWNSTNAVAIKSDTIEFSGPGTYYIYISAYELDYWDLEIHEYY